MRGPILAGAFGLVTFACLLLVSAMPGTLGAATCAPDPNQFTCSIDPNHPAFYVDLANSTGIEDGSPAHPFRTIQRGLDGARDRNNFLAPLASSDPNFHQSQVITQLFVARGTYRETITLRSHVKLIAADPNTIIDGGGFGPVVLIPPVFSDTGIECFTITGGIGFIGGGLLAQGGNPRIAKNIITENRVRGSANSAARGGGLAVAANAVVEGNLITNNLALLGSGGGISLTSGSPIISRNTICGNRALSSSEAYFGYGGGIEVERTVSFPAITNNIIQGNRAEAGGGGIDVYRASPSITHNVIVDNEALGVGALPGSGGGINVIGERRRADSVTPSIVNNVIMNNRARVGGGVNAARARPFFAGNDFYDNKPDDGGRPHGPIGLDLNIGADPLFVDPNNPALDPNSFQLQSGSPLIDAGSNGVLEVEPGPNVPSGNTPSFDPDANSNLYHRLVPLPRFDMLNTPRPILRGGSSGSGFDVGAFEFVPDATDPNRPNDLDHDDIPTESPTDSDGDPNTPEPPCLPPPDPNGVFQMCNDNCPLTYNDDQADLDGDGVGDACDNCPGDLNGFYDPNSPSPLSCSDRDKDGNVSRIEGAHCNQHDTDGDFIGDLCDADRDNDGFLEDSDGDPNTLDPCTRGRREGCDDNCPDVTNATQRDVDRDGVGDACDNCPRKRNGDCSVDESFCDMDHRAGADPNEIALGNQLDTDDDGIGDACDNCRDVPNGTCGLLAFPDACNVDMSVDPNTGLGTTTAQEAAFGNQRDQDRDHKGDACDEDRDNDGIDQELLFDPNSIRLPCSGGGTTDCNDNCTTRRNPTQADSDGDGVGDPCDNCDFVRNGPCDSADPNTLGFCNVNLDPNVDANEIALGNQKDFDSDRQGDACDPDDDNDGIFDDGDPNANTPCLPSSDPNIPLPPCDDNCPLAFNKDQADLDADGQGDACDPDADGDMIDQYLASDPNTILGEDRTDPNNVVKTLLLPCAGGAASLCSDNCPRVYNPGQEDGDVDPNGLPLGDGVGDACDNCPSIPDSFQVDRDNDAIGDVCDNCPSISNFTQEDSDGDGVGDACENLDLDLDCVPEQFDPNASTPSRCSAGLTPADDNCAATYNPGQEDTEVDPNGLSVADGVGDACDNCPTLPNGDCSIDPLRCDVNLDGVVDPNEIALGSQLDSDSDGVGDACDVCPLPGSGVADADGDRVNDDGDRDGVPGDHPCRGGDHTRCDDNCPCEPNPAQEDLDRDRLGDACDPDDDNDGVLEDADIDPNTVFPCAGGNKMSCDDNCPGLYNPGQEDADGDGIGDRCDTCPDPNNNGDALQSDSDGDGIGDACDNCPPVFNAGQADANGNGIGDACEGPTLSLTMRTRGDTAGVVTPGALVKLEVGVENRGGAGERVDVEVSLRDPSGDAPSRVKRFSIEAFAGEVSRTRTAIRIPGGARSGTWLVVADAKARGSGAELSASLAVAVK